MAMVVLSFMLASALAAVHLLVERLKALRAMPRSRWLSAAAGSSVAYVFVHIFPEMGAHQQTLDELEVAEFLQHHVYLVALLGFCVYYGLERAAQQYGEAGRAEQESRQAHKIFQVHLGAFALYYGLVGYLLLHRDHADATELVIYALAMGLHFTVIDVSLSAHHRRPYHRYGRWLLSAAVLTGWALGWLGPLYEELLGVLFAFLAGGIVLNAIKDELPVERQSRYWAFAGGAVGFGLLLIFVEA